MILWSPDSQSNHQTQIRIQLRMNMNVQMEPTEVPQFNRDAPVNAGSGIGMSAVSESTTVIQPPSTLIALGSCLHIISLVRCTGRPREVVASRCAPLASFLKA